MNFLWFSNWEYNFQELKWEYYVILWGSTELVKVLSDKFSSTRFIINKEKSSFGRNGEWIPTEDLA